MVILTLWIDEERRYLLIFTSESLKKNFSLWDFFVKSEQLFWTVQFRELNTEESKNHKQGILLAV